MTNFGFGQKGAIVKITAISGFATCDVNRLTPGALRAHAPIDQIPTGFLVFLLVHHGGENARQGDVSLRACGRLGSSHPLTPISLRLFA